MPPLPIVPTLMPADVLLPEAVHTQEEADNLVAHTNFMSKKQRPDVLLARPDHHPGHRPFRNEPDAGGLQESIRLARDGILLNELRQREAMDMNMQQDQNQ